MKKRMLAALLFACMLLSACTTAFPAETKETHGVAQEPVKATEPPAPQKKEVVEAVYHRLPVEDSYYQYGNMQVASGDPQFILYGDEVLFVGGTEVCRTYAYDLNTGKVRRFCDMPGCDHTGSDCQVVSLSWGGVEQYGGKLYIRGANGALRVLEDGHWEAIGIGGSSSCHAYGDLFVCQGSRLSVYYGGKGQRKEILDDYGYMFNVVFDGFLYSTNKYDLVRVNLLADNPVKETVLEGCYTMVEGSHIYYVDNADETGFCYLYRCDMDGSNSELLLDQPVLPASLNFDEEYLYFRLFADHKIDGTEEGYHIYRMSKEDPTRVEKLVTLPDTVYQIFTVPGQDVLFVQARYKDSNYRRHIRVYVMRRDGSDLKLLELP